MPLVEIFTEPLDGAALVFWHHQKIPVSSSGFSEGPALPRAPETAERWIVGTSHSGSEHSAPV